MANTNMWSRPEDEAVATPAPVVASADASPVLAPVEVAPAVAAPVVSATVVPTAPLTLLERLAAEARHIEQEIAIALKG